MRRAIALLLMLVFSSMLMAPLFAADPEAGLPPCCRSRGKHHCMMQRMHRPDGRPAFAAVGDRCPCFPAGTAASHSGQFVPTASHGGVAIALVASGFLPDTRVLCLSAYSDCHPKRGPPSPLA